MSVSVKYSDELYHYGVKGMKWGIRRFQNPDGTLTAEGKKHYSAYSNDPRALRKAIKRDKQGHNVKATRLSNEAAFYGGAVEKSSKMLSKYEKKKDKAAYERAQKIVRSFMDQEVASKKAVQDHYDELVRMYGAEAVKPIKYDKRGHVKSNTDTRTAVSDITGNIASAILLAMGFPIGVFSYTESHKSAGKSAAKRVFAENGLK